jgi:hypothetical protein
VTEAEADVWRTVITVAGSVLGTLLGAVVGIGGAFLVERSRREHEERRRFLDVKRDRYATFQQRVSEAITAEMHHIADMESKGLPPNEPPRPGDLLVQAVQEIGLLNETVGHAAQRVVDVLFDGDWLLPPETGSPYQRSKPVRDRVEVEMARFRQLARKDLGTG